MTTADPKFSSEAPVENDLIKSVSVEALCAKRDAIMERIQAASVLNSELFVGVGYSGGRAEKLDDLARAFHVLDGKPEPDHRDGLRAQLHRRKHEKSRFEFGDDYVSVKAFANGNAHITFKRPDLVERCNQMIASRHPGALPAAR